MKYLIIFYDGPCVLCNYWIQKLCQWDKENHFKFTSLESKFAIDFFNKNPSPILKKDAIISWDSEKGYHAEAEAVFRILTSLKGFFNFFLRYYYRDRILKGFSFFSAKKTEIGFFIAI